MGGALTPLVVRGMHGMGDNFHQRAIVRELATRHAPLWLETPWPCLYYDLLAGGVNLVRARATLRTQAKNAAREAASYHCATAPSGVRELRVSYSPDEVRRQGSVLAAMARHCGCAAGDFRMPIPFAWKTRARRLIDQMRPGKPLLIYRPLTERTEWQGSFARNPDHAAYAALFRSVAARFFVVSIADLVPRVEWLVGEAITADVTLHAGELDVETMAALVEHAALVYCAPGFAIIMAQAVGTPVAAVFGGYESSRSYSSGARFSPFLGIDPITPCDCFAHKHDCRKAIDLPAAIERLEGFADAAIAGDHAGGSRDRLVGAPAPLPQPG